MLIWDAPGTGRTYVAIDNPRPGTWTINEGPGSPPIASLATALPRPDAKITAHVSGRGSKRTLRYRVRPRTGQTVTFVETGPETYRVLGRARGRRGAIRFRPAGGPGGRRAIEARLTLDGIPNANLTVARHRAPRPVTPARPRLRVTHRGSRLAIRWSARQGVRRWAVAVSRHSGARRLLLLPARRRALRVNVPAAANGEVTVRGLGDRNLTGPSATKRFRATRHARTRFAAPLSSRALRAKSRR